MILSKWNNQSHPQESAVFVYFYYDDITSLGLWKITWIIPKCRASHYIRWNLILNYICKPSLLCWSGTIKQLIFCTIPETTMSRYFMPWTASYVRFPPSLFSVMSISSWSLDWTSGCVASRCEAKHKSVEPASKPAIKKSTACPAKSSSSHSVLRTQDSNSDKHVGYEKRM